MYDGYKGLVKINTDYKQQTKNLGKLFKMRSSSKIVEGWDGLKN